MKILAVDDEPYILELMPMLARRIGFSDVSTAASGTMALEALAAADTAYDCLLLDINMPGMDGIELCRRVRAIEAYRRTPIIMLTAMSERDFMDRAFQAGATDYVTKPFDINELGARLRVAQELVAARRAVDTTGAGRLARDEQDVESGQVGPVEEISLDGIGNLADGVALTNYLKQLSRSGLGASQIIAVMIDQFDKLHARAIASELHYALSEVLAAVHTTMLTNIALIAYTGNGVFVIVSNAASALSSVEIESNLQYLLDERNAEYDDGSPMDLEVSIGNPVLPPVGNIAAVEASVERAVARASSRSATRRDTPRMPNIRRNGQ